jgi:hypothetical protein
VTVTSLDATRLLVSTAVDLPGSGSVTFNIAAGSSTIPTFYLQALAGTATAQFQASAPCYATDTSNCHIQPVGLHLQQQQHLDYDEVGG